MVAIALVFFAIGYSLEGAGLGADAWLPGTNVVLLVVGSIMTIAAFLTMRYYGWSYFAYGYSNYRTESEKFDTTDDE